MTTASPVRRLRAAGIAASPGCHSGSAHVLKGLTDTAGLAPGSVIVAQEARAELMPALRMAGAIVTTGGMLTNLATLAREFGIPCVVLDRQSLLGIRTGDPITVDGTTGIVTTR